MWDSDVPSMLSFSLIISLSHTQCWQSGVRTIDCTTSLYVFFVLTCVVLPFPYVFLFMSVCLCLCLPALSLICVLQLNLFGSTPTLSSSPASIHPKQIPSEGRRGESAFSRCFSLSFLTHAHTQTHTQARIIATQWVDRCGGTVKQFVIEVIWFKILSISLDRPVRCVYVGEEIKQWRWQREYRASNLNHHTHTCTRARAHTQKGSTPNSIGQQRSDA